MDEQYASPALAAVHETALDLAEAGVLEKRTMKTFDAMCLTPVESLDPRQIKRIRLRDWVGSPWWSSLESNSPDGVCTMR